MTPNEYQKLSQRSAADTAEQAHKLINTIEEKPRLARIICAALKLNSESGELADAIVKHICYGQVLDEKNIVEECGDLCWYIQEILECLNENFEDVMVDNVEKLKIRYPEKFTEKDALERKDKQ